MSIEPSGRNPESGHGIVFFDGMCGLCNGFVDFTLERDHRAWFRFSPLQGETFATTVAPTPPRSGISRGKPGLPDGERLASIVFWDGERSHLKSEAVLRVFEGLGGTWRLARGLRWVPRTIRDAVYDVVAKNRYRWFGKREACRLPSAAEKDRFLP